MWRLPDWCDLPLAKCDDTPCFPNLQNYCIGRAICDVMPLDPGRMTRIWGRRQWGRHWNGGLGIRPRAPPARKRI